MTPPLPQKLVVLCAILKTGPGRNVLSHNLGWHIARSQNWGMLCCSGFNGQFRGPKGLVLDATNWNLISPFT
ncbi:hypothetical protein IWW34DRAFT_746992 [Fusarium oxysporum f. sp. albedinis]|nr:hypothetical protein IWW34DRAFT_746992 [Fusarium oxysporum f. sp. albedinis]